MKKFYNSYVYYVFSFLTVFMLVFIFSCAPTPTVKRSFVKKDCLVCHQDFKEQFLAKKNLHSPMKENSCEACHLRHGVIGQLLLKKQGNALCFDCHDTEALGLNRPFPHTALSGSGTCTTCHNPHSSDFSNLLKGEDTSACYECHDKKAFEKSLTLKFLDESLSRKRSVKVPFKKEIKMIKS